LEVSAGAASFAANKMAHRMSSKCVLNAPPRIDNKSPQNLPSMRPNTVLGHFLAFESEAETEMADG